MNTIPYPQSVIIKCTNCEREAEDLDDDGYCEDCVIEIEISRAEANNDRD